ncbi:MAG: hypothetical protein H0X04_00265 [Chthoniobacterales bacterium]|nr:hypothetical protein [Chthoniobacterales bacterium]
MEAYAKQLGCDNDPWSLATTLVNMPKTRNYQTACALIFGLSFVTHKEYLLRAAKLLEQQHTEAEHFDVTNDWLIDWRNYFMAEVEEYPKDAL